ncbi:MAG: response regulator [Bacteroidetes bacterium]|jgi:two-component system, LytTR family, response regulator|nr:response regulator [Bacteroidota bacterium]MBT4401132.1 response regulator [Bacteroidota bacterium]MBT4408620.1 response regulator [Bacteroidota bacterium]MBT7466112.1 response regulator [Bacteroidota bacterium]
MSKIKIIIIDDERLARKELVFLLKDIQGVVVQGEADNIKDAIELIAAKNPDLILLDIQLSRENGFDLLKILPANIKVICVTAYPEYAQKAFEENATDFLLKPVDPKRLKSALKSIMGNAFEKFPDYP